MYGWNEFDYFFKSYTRRLIWVALKRGFNLSDQSETVLQIRVSEDLKKRIAVKAFEREQTLRSFVLAALKAHGVEIPDRDLSDRRKQRGGKASHE